MAAYRTSLAWLLRLLAAAAIVLTAFYLPAIFDSESASDRTISLSQAINVMALACVALVIAEVLASTRLGAVPFVRGFAWLMRGLGVAVLLWCLPTLFGVFRTFVISNMSLRDVLQSLSFTLTSLLSAPLLFLACAEALIQSARHHPTDGQPQ